MQISLDIARTLSPGLISRSTQWHDSNWLLPTEQHGKKCFTSSFTVGELNTYFGEASHGQYFRKKARQRLLLERRQAPSTRAQVRVLLLDRPVESGQGAIPVRERPAPRPLWNINEVEQTLRIAGLRTIRRASISAVTPYWLQAQLFQWADLIVSIHGSHLANLLFMPDWTVIVELFPHKYFSAQPAVRPPISNSLPLSADRHPL